MNAITIHAAKTGLSQLLARVEAGEEILIARGKEPIAKLVPLHPPASKRRFCALGDVLQVGPEFFEPLPDDELSGWEG